MKLANLPHSIEESISSILARQDNTKWISQAVKLHNKYMAQEKGYIHEFTDILSYLALRTPATYAQISAAFSHVANVISHWQPESILDLGSGPGPGVWAAQTIWPSITEALCVDQEKYFISVAQEIFRKSTVPLNVTWERHDLLNIQRYDNKKYDLVLIANVLNEFTEVERENVLEYAYSRCKGVMVIVEPGTPLGFDIAQTAAKTYSEKGILIAPYINNSFVHSNSYWIHFPQRFTRPEFLRRVRQHMRDDSLMASDWEEAKYSYVAVGKIRPQERVWARCIGPVQKQKGFLEVPLLTEHEILQLKVMKRYKKEYSFAKNLHWGELINNKLKVSLTI